jgi:signal transduction histidine kinase
VQEAINNILKHADATSILIDIHFEKTEFIIQIRDNGKGYQLTENTRGAGLKNIQKRVGMVNGEIEMITNAGTLINIKIPI